MRWALVAVALVLAAAVNSVIIVRSPAGPLADLTHYKHWTHLVTVEGMHAAYRGEYPETYAIYPPVTLAVFLAAGLVYERAVDPTFDLDRALASHELSVLIRLQALLFHTLVGLAVYAVARHATSFGAAYAATIAYLLNPGAIFDVAQWGQPDPVFGLFVLLALAAAAWGAPRAWLGAPPGDSTRSWPSTGARGGLVHILWHGLGDAGRLGPRAAALAGLCIVLAALAKPQAWVFLPLVAGLVWRRGGVRGLVYAGAAGAAAGLVVVLPYLLHGTLRQLLSLPREISSVMPVVSANAHNVWWVFSDGAARWYLDQDPFVGPLSYRLVGVGLVGAFAGLALLRALREPSFGAIFTAGAFTGFGFFMGMTQIHENHMYVVFPLLAVAAAVDRRLWPLYAILAVTWCADMLLHDFDLAESGLEAALPWTAQQAQQLNAAINTLVLGGWTAWLVVETARAWFGRRAPQPPAPVASEA
jgi:hypothetical protein